MFAPPDVLTGDDPEIVQLYGCRHVQYMAALQADVRKAAGRVADQFQRKLRKLPSLTRLVDSLSARELAEFKSAQARELVALACPDLTEQSHASAARATGLRNAILGVSREEIADGFGLLLASLHEELNTHRHAAAFCTLGRRIVRELTLQFQVYAELQGSRNEVLAQVTHLAWTVDSYTDLIHSVMRIIGAHAEVAGCCVGRPDSEGFFHYESVFGPQTEDYINALEKDARQRISIGDQPQGRGPTGRAWTNRRIEQSINLATDPAVATWRSRALAAGFHSSVAIPLCTPDEEPRAVLALYRKLPGGHSNEQVAFVQQLQSLLAFALERIEDRNGRSSTIPYATRKKWSALLRSDCLEMHYQPILDLETGAISSVEALARLRGGDELLTPGQLLPACTSEDLLELFMRGLEQATRNVSRWRAAGFAIKVTVNLPPVALADSRYFEHTRQTLEAASCPPHALMLEILETEDVPAGVEIRRELDKYRRLGVGLAQDDLGAGYSSLARLRDLPFDCIKIDRGIVSRADQDPCDMLKFASQLIRLSHSMGKSVTVEGIENPALLEAMAILGADRVQGFAIARPMSARQLDAWLACAVVPALPDPARPSSRLGKLAQLLIWEESLRMLALAKSQTRRLSARGPFSRQVSTTSKADDVEDLIDPLLKELSNSLPNLADDISRMQLVTAVIRYGVESWQYLRARRRLVDRIADGA
ncbi:RNase II stability modulator [Caballeronia hypogeia]|uniref:RNase II stability modulator n=1 Tax=Caballeronia hypogeia TaxID=1777140 RepID=A0A158DQA7_9BURK|nr:EAL domain-containing protein [Caballeronia hypogeia]SAK96802.1 RNase II stability modulator [Caballeronia hypogeia]